MTAYNPCKAVNYADTYVFYPNLPKYPPFSSDCTNFVSQILKEGGLQTSNDWYYNSVLSYSRTWAVADDLKWYLKDMYGATKLSPGWSKGGTPEPYKTYAYINDSANIPNTGDVVIFYDWEPNGKMNHSSYCVGTDHGDIVNQHTENRKRVVWHLDPYNVKRETTKIYAFRI